MPAHADGPAQEAPDQAWQRIYAAGRHAASWPASTAPSSSHGRAADDAAAAWRRWHDGRSDGRFAPAEWPWYALMERARVETLASADLPGLKHNLAQFGALLPPTSAAQALYRSAREVFRSEDPGRAAPASLPAAPPQHPRRWFARPAASRPPVPDDAEVLRVLGAAKRVLDDAQGFAGVVQALARTLAACYEAAPELALAPGDDAPGGTTADATATGPEETSDAVVARAPTETPREQLRDASYAIYSPRWDEVVDAKSLVNERDPAPLALTDDQRRQVAHLAQRLQRRLLAARQTRWSFDQEAGLLDSRRLSRLLTPGGSGAVFRQEQTDLVPEACVTLLVDQSGSMRGERQRIVALAVEFAAQTLEACRIRCEVLGYTTRFGADNPVVDAWRRAGAPPRPGRLNALRHIVYKSAAQPWRGARGTLRLLLREGFGKENVDGESLAWAARRLAARPEPRKVLLVLCDGAPHDAATSGAMGRAFLEDHLRRVIHRIEAGTIHLAAFGAGGDVGRFYRHAIALRDTGAVAPLLFEHLGDVLTGDTAPATRFR